jgi:hypothetical protein
MEITVDRYQQAKKCIQILSSDFLRIKSEYIDKRKYRTAFLEWSFSMLASQHIILEPYIEKFYMGETFNVAAKMLKEKLEKQDELGVDFFSKQLIMFIKQQELREKTDTES